MRYQRAPTRRLVRLPRQLQQTNSRVNDKENSRSYVRQTTAHRHRPEKGIFDPPRLQCNKPIPVPRGPWPAPANDAHPEPEEAGGGDVEGGEAPELALEGGREEFGPCGQMDGAVAHAGEPEGHAH